MLSRNQMISLNSVRSAVSDAVDAANEQLNTVRSQVGDLTGRAARFIGFDLPKGAMPTAPTPATVNIQNKYGEGQQNDLRVKIRVPQGYLKLPTIGGANQELAKLKGIVFPYTPSITYDVKADYSTLNPTHSNFAIYSYKNSSVSSINISGRFTVQNDRDAAVYLSAVHLLHALTKMRSGGTDILSGSPPPVCRLDAYGEFNLQNVPVAIGAFKVDLPDNVDYYTVTDSNLSFMFSGNAVPTIATISITCLPMYSRREMQQFTVDGWLSPESNRKSGYL